MAITLLRKHKGGAMLAWQGLVFCLAGQGQRLQGNSVAGLETSCDLVASLLPGIDTYPCVRHGFVDLT